MAGAASATTQDAGSGVLSGKGLSDGGGGGGPGATESDAESESWVENLELPSSRGQS